MVYCEEKWADMAISSEKGITSCNSSYKAKVFDKEKEEEEEEEKREITSQKQDMLISNFR